jgi:glutathione S-transferase
VLSMHTPPTAGPGTRPLKLYAIPFACSLASHIALREAGLPHEIVWVTRTSLRLQDGGDLRQINPKGKVATLVHGDGTLVTENLAILLSIADLRPEARLAPPADSPLRVRLHEWLSFVATEIHKQVLWAWFNPSVPEVMKEHVSKNLLPDHLRHAEAALSGGRFLLGEDFTVADAYLFWALLLTPQLGVKLEDYPALVAFREAVKARPSVREVLAVEKRGLDAGFSQVATR